MEGVHGQAEQQGMQQGLGPFGKVGPAAEDADIGPAPRQGVHHQHGGGPFGRPVVGGEVDDAGAGVLVEEDVSEQVTVDDLGNELGDPAGAREHVE